MPEVTSSYLALTAGAMLVLLAVVLSVSAMTTARKARRSVISAMEIARQAQLPSRVVDRGAGVQALHREILALREELSQLQARVQAITDRPSAGPVYEMMRSTRDMDRTESTPPQMASQPVTQAVDFDGTVLRRSKALSTLGALKPEDGHDGLARLYLNEEVSVDHIAFEKWSKLVEFRGGTTYMRYRTLEPALINWDEQAGQGVLVQRGLAEAIE